MADPSILSSFLVFKITLSGIYPEVFYCTSRAHSEYRVTYEDRLYRYTVLVIAKVTSSGLQNFSTVFTHGILIHNCGHIFRSAEEAVSFSVASGAGHLNPMLCATDGTNN